jgi:protein-disulfide isomerase
MRAAQAAKVAGTPTFFLGALQADGTILASTRLVGNVPFEQMQAALDKLLLK